MEVFQHQVSGGAGEMVQWLTILVALEKDPGLVPSTQVVPLTTSCNSSFQ